MSYVNVQIDISDIDTDDLIEDVERRGYRVLMPGQIDEDVEALHRTLDEINNLYYSFLAWKDGSVKNEYFENEIKTFFDTTMDKVIL